MVPTQTVVVSPRVAPWPRHVARRRRVWLFLAAYADLLWLDLRLQLGYPSIRKAVARIEPAAIAPDDDTLQLVRLAVRDACVFYFKPVMCLQRSSAVTRMLRRRGIAADLVVGYLPVPMQSHAWVEVNGTVVWDRFTLQQFLRVVDRF